MTQHIVADLHNHTTASDGDFAPAELIRQAKEAGLKTVAISDHDTINGLNEAIDAGSKFDVNVVTAVEVTIRFKRDYFVGSLHLLLYFSKSLLENKYFMADLNKVLSQGRGDDLVRGRVALINEIFGPNSSSPRLSRPLQFSEVTSYSNNVTRRHFALTLREKHGFESREAINELIGNDSRAYLPAGVELGQLKPLLEKYNFLVVLAHPAAGSFPGNSHYKEVLPTISVVEKIFPEFIDIGLGGMEVFYPGHTTEHCALLLSWCDKYGLIATGGSDCHDNLSRPIGVAGLNEVNYSIFDKLYSNL